MADTVSTQIIENGPRNLIMKFVNFSDGTGETNAVKVNASTLGLSLTSTKIKEIEYNITGGALLLLWDATTANQIAYLSGWGKLCAKDTQGFFNPNTTGNTGNVLFTTSGFSAAGAGPPKTPASGYTIVLYMIKGNSPT